MVSLCGAARFDDLSRDDQDGSRTTSLSHEFQGGHLRAILLDLPKLQINSVSFESCGGFLFRKMKWRRWWPCRTINNTNSHFLSTPNRSRMASLWYPDRSSNLAINGRNTSLFLCLNPAVPAREPNGTNSTSRGFVAWPGPAISDGFFAPWYPRGPVYDLGQAGVILSARALSNIEASSWSHILALLLFRIYFHNFYCSIKCPRKAEARRAKWSENNNGHHRSRKDDDVRIIGTSVSFRSGLGTRWPRRPKESRPNG